MSGILVFVLLGFIVGTFGTLIGAGGGFILVPVLLLAYPDLPPDVVTAISMAVVATNAISGSIAYARSGRIDYKAGIKFAAFTIPGSIIGVYITRFIPLEVFHVVFGILLLLLSAYLFLKNTKAAHAGVSPPIAHTTDTRNRIQRAITDKHGSVFSYSYNQTYGIIISVLVGFISPILGIGGGIVHVPAMVQWLGFPVYIATATSHFILAIMASVSVGVHLFQGSYMHQAVADILPGLCIGIIPGALLGAYLSHRIGTHIIIRVLAVCLALVGIRVLL